MEPGNTGYKIAAEPVDPVLTGMTKKFGKNFIQPLFSG
jgi:hypothetical protein